MLLANEVRSKDIERAELQAAVERYLESGKEIDTLENETLERKIARGIEPERAKGKKYTKEEEAIIRRMSAGGFSVMAIAEKLGRYWNSVNAKMRMMGLLIVEIEDVEEV